MADRSGPLVGLRVVELAGIGPAELGCMVLADLGADVTRIDRVTSVSQGGPGPPARGVLGRGRRSIAIDIRRPEGAELVRMLVEGADVLIDPFRPGVLERVGLAPPDLLERNERLIIARMTGWGQDGPLARAAGHDLNYIAVAGALHPMGEADALPPVPLNLIADYGGGGMLMVAGILAGLYERGRSGRGQVIDVAMVDGVATLLASVFHLRGAGARADARRATSHLGAARIFGT